MQNIFCLLPAKGFKYFEIEWMKNVINSLVF